MKDRFGPNVSVTIDDRHVATAVIDNPPNNHIHVDLIRDLADALEALDGEKACRAIILSTGGKNFCAGADLVANSNGSGAVAAGGSPLYEQAMRLFAAQTPIVAAVQGSAVGAGLGLALVADFRVATPDAKFSANFVKLGFHPGFGLTHTLPRLIGRQRAGLMLLTGRRVKVEDALKWGLVDEVAPVDGLMDAARSLAHEIAENAPLAIVATRKTLRGDLAEAVRAQTDIEFKKQSILRMTDDYKEGVRAVKERRPGNFTGR